MTQMSYGINHICVGIDCKYEANFLLKIKYPIEVVAVLRGYTASKQARKVFQGRQLPTPNFNETIVFVMT